MVSNALMRSAIISHCGIHSKHNLYEQCRQFVCLSAYVYIMCIYLSVCMCVLALICGCICVYSFIQAISIAPLQVYYYSEAFPTHHEYCVGVSCKWRAYPRSLRGG